MKKLHIFLVTLNIISMILLIQIVFNWIPSFECNYSVDHIDRINNLIVDLCVGVITSTLFYYLLVVTPERKKRSSIRLINQNLLNYTVDNMQEIIAYFSTSYLIESSGEQYLAMNEEDFNKITEIRDIQTGFCFVYETDIESIIDLRGWDEMAFINSRTNAIKSYAKQFLSIPIIIFEDEELIEIMSDIDKCHFIWAIDMLYMNRENEITVPNIGQYIIPFYRLYLKLSKYAKPSRLIIKEEEFSTLSPLKIELI